jgi:hypothetical protein
MVASEMQRSEASHQTEHVDSSPVIIESFCNLMQKNRARGFLQLPAELRNRIYDLAVNLDRPFRLVYWNSDDPLWSRTRDRLSYWKRGLEAVRSKTGGRLALAYTCSQIRMEFRTLLKIQIQWNSVAPFLRLMHSKHCLPPKSLAIYLNSLGVIQPARKTGRGSGTYSQGTECLIEEPKYH